MTVSPAAQVSEPGAGADLSVGTSMARGAVATMSRQAVRFAMAAVAGLVLARNLPPTSFGLYSAAALLFGFLVAFGDAGLGASLLQQPDRPTRRDYGVVFTVQLLGALLLTAATAVVALLWRPPGLPDAPLVALLVAGSVLVTTCQVVPAVRLERDLAFDRLAAVRVVEAVVFHGGCVVLVLMGVGVVAFGWALLTQAVIGLVLLLVLRPGLPPFVLDLAAARHRLGFGLPYQAASLVSMLKDAISPVFVGWLLGAASVGYIGWAGTFAAYPVLALFALDRLYLGGFARLQHDPVRLARAVERVVWCTNAFVAPLAVCTLVLRGPITDLVFGATWRPALQLFVLLWCANLVVPTATPLLGLLNAVGRSGSTFRFCSLWMVINWVLGVPLIAWLGLIGYGITNVVAQPTILLLVRSCRRSVPVRLGRPVVEPWLAVLPSALLLALVEVLSPPRTLPALATCVLAALLVYVGTLATAFPRTVRSVVGTLLARA